MTCQWGQMKKPCKECGTPVDTQRPVSAEATAWCWQHMPPPFKGISETDFWCSDPSPPGGCEALRALQKLVAEGRPSYDGDKPGDGFCQYCHELTCDTDCVWVLAYRAANSTGSIGLGEK